MLGWGGTRGHKRTGSRTGRTDARGTLSPTGYARVILAGAAFANVDNVTTFTWCYMISAFLDVMDGYAARYLNQCTQASGAPLVQHAARLTPCAFPWSAWRGAAPSHDLWCRARHGHGPVKCQRTRTNARPLRGFL